METGRHTKSKINKVASIPATTVLLPAVFPCFDKYIALLQPSFPRHRFFPFLYFIRAEAILLGQRSARVYSTERNHHNSKKKKRNKKINKSFNYCTDAREIEKRRRTPSYNVDQSRIKLRTTWRSIGSVRTSSTDVQYSKKCTFHNYSSQTLNAIVIEEYSGAVGNEHQKKKCK